MSRTLRKLRKIEYRALPDETKGLQEKEIESIDKTIGKEEKTRSLAI